LPKTANRIKKGHLVGNLINALKALPPSVVRLARGSVVKAGGKKPKKLLELYEAEYCPFCRYVREALTELDLDALIHPVPKKGQRFRSRVEKLGGKGTVPFLRDPNTGTQMYDSEAIVNYLYAQYDPDGATAPSRVLRTSVMATALRGTQGMFVKPSTAPAKRLELYSFESSPYCRMVRETLCELEIPYVLRSVGKSSAIPVAWLTPAARNFLNLNDTTPLTQNRQKLLRRAGRVQVPYLIDPNTNTAMFESADIQRYLRETYGA
jgi:glutathione S-transferase